MLSTPKERLASPLGLRLGPRPLRPDLIGPSRRAYATLPSPCNPALGVLCGFTLSAKQSKSGSEAAMKTWGILLLVLALVGVAISVFLKPAWSADPIRSTSMLLKEPNPVPLPVRFQVFSRLRRGDSEPLFAIRPGRKKSLRLETTNAMVIRSVVEAMRKTAKDEIPWHSPPAGVVSYHLYFEMSDSKLPLYYQFYYKAAADEPSSITGASTAGNLWNAEGLERWFATNNLLPPPE